MPRTQELTFFVPGPAVGKDFVGFKIGDRVMVVPDRKSQDYMKLLVDAANTALNTFGDWQVPELGVPVQVWIVEKVAIRKSYSNKVKAQLLGTLCTAKPDDDNVENCVFDALTGVLPRKKKDSDLSPGEREVNKRRTRIAGMLPDDAQIAFNQTIKVWSEAEDAGLYVRIRTGAFPVAQMVKEALGESA